MIFIKILGIHSTNSLRTTLVRHKVGIIYFYFKSLPRLQYTIDQYHYRTLPQIQLSPGQNVWRPDTFFQVFIHFYIKHCFVWNNQRFREVHQLFFLSDTYKKECFLLNYKLTNVSRVVDWRTLTFLLFYFDKVVRFNKLELFSQNTW
jgi:hypothetical protein